MKFFSRMPLLAVLVLCCQSLSFGWGCSGHQIVALIAERQLTPAAASAVQALLKDADLYNGLRRYCQATELGFMAGFASWADDYRNIDKSTGPWHYWDIPLNAVARPAESAFCDEGCVTKAIQDQIKVLKSDAAKPEKAKALAFLIHFVGDMHQPLHVVSNNDRGGNCVPVAFFGRQPASRDPAGGNYNPNLHAVWDSDLLEKIGGIRKATHDDDIVQLVDSIMSDYEDQLPEWSKQGVDITGWAFESFQLARKSTYGNLTHPVSPEAPVNVENCNGDNHISQRMLALHESINKKYLNSASPVIQEQLAKAGTRLAVILNQTLQ
jgi:hypothetical protein